MGSSREGKQLTTLTNMQKRFSVRQLFVAAAVVAMWTAAAAALPGQAIDPAVAAKLLSGTIDIHVHAAPDNVPRSIDGLDVAKLARARGMRAIVLKNHYEPTASLAFLARKEAP